jgi:hypothetical protein
MLLLGAKDPVDTRGETSSNLTSTAYRIIFHTTSRFMLIYVFMCHVLVDFWPDLAPRACCFSSV